MVCRKKNINTRSNLKQLGEEVHKPKALSRLILVVQNYDLVLHLNQATSTFNETERVKHRIA